MISFFFFIKILKFQTEVNYFELNLVNVALRPLTMPLIVLNPKFITDFWASKFHLLI